MPVKNRSALHGMQSDPIYVIHLLKETIYKQIILQQYLEPKVLIVFKGMEVNFFFKIGHFKYKRRQACLPSCHIKRKTCIKQYKKKSIMQQLRENIPAQGELNKLQR